MKPILPWIGGKTKLLKKISPFLPKEMEPYYEPFLGGGALLFHLQPKVAYINDLNKDLMNVYKQIKENPERVVYLLFSFGTDEDDYYRYRDIFNCNQVDDITRAALCIYLVKIGYGNQFRVNSKGLFNIPYATEKRYYATSSNYIRNLIMVSNYLNSACIEFSSMDYFDYIMDIEKGFVYLDPPYDKLKKSSFTKYTPDGFVQEEVNRLWTACHQIDVKGVKFMLSNVLTDTIAGKFSMYNVHEIETRDAFKWGTKKEVLITNY